MMDNTTQTPVPHLENLKAGSQELKTQLVEHTNGADGESHDRHLSTGVSETREEKVAHWFIGSIDQGTTSSRFLIFNGEGNPIASHQIEFENMYPEPG
jgi:glycerol kinase